MISYWFMLFLSWITALFVSPLLLFPDVSLSAGLTTALTTAGGYVNGMGFILPLDTLFQVFGAYIAVEVGLAAYKAIKWVYTKIPGIS